jgi:hypothetical protein
MKPCLLLLRPDCRLAYLWIAGRNDMYGGLTRVMHSLDVTTEAIFNHIIAWHVVVFAASLVIAVMYVLLLLKPFLRRNMREAARMADMLSQLPPDMDVDLLINQALHPGRGTASPACTLTAAARLDARAWLQRGRGRLRA